MGCRSASCCCSTSPRRRTRPGKPSGRRLRRPLPCPSAGRGGGTFPGSAPATAQGRWSGDRVALSRLLLPFGEWRRGSNDECVFGPPQQADPLPGGGDGLGTEVLRVDREGPVVRAVDGELVVDPDVSSDPKRARDRVPPAGRLRAVVLEADLLRPHADFDLLA